MSDYLSRILVSPTAEPGSGTSVWKNTNPALAVWALVMPELSIGQRKAILTVLRVQQPLDRNPTLNSLVRGAFPTVQGLPPYNGRPGWHFLKRPFQVDGDQIVSGHLLDLPILAALFSERHPDDCHTVEPAKNPWERNYLFITQASRLLTKLPLIETTKQDRLSLLSLFQRVYEYLDLPLNGGFPPHDPVYPTLEGVTLVIPPVCEEIFIADWLEVLYEMHHPEKLRLPELDDSWREDVFRGKLGELIEGNTYITGPIALSRYLTQMGHISVQSMMKYVDYSDETWAVYVSYIRGVNNPSDVRLQRVTICDAIPWFFHDISIGSPDVYLYDSDSDSD
jgi:hypothetical protein